MLLEKETVLGKELDELIQSLRPGIELPSKKIDDTEPESQKASETS
jgi:cell division protease FtsH